MTGPSQTPPAAADRPLRIGALAQRTGTTTHLLRVWEERYQLLVPQRSSSGYRLYGAEDERRVREMVALRSQGVAAAEAAERVLRLALDRSRPAPLGRLLEELLAAFERYDDAAAHELVDRALTGHPVEAVVDDLFFPALRHLGDEWEAGRVTVAQEHYASSLIRGRMLAVGPDLEPGASGPSAVLACTSHERHDIGLVALNLLLRRNGWQVTFLGADTPVVDAVTLADDIPADVLVLCGTEPYMYAAQLEQHAIALRTRRRGVHLALAGRAANPELAREHDAELLVLDPQRAADQLDRLRVLREPVSDPALDLGDLGPELAAFWTERHLCTLTTLRADGSPHVVAVGVALDVELGCAWVITDGASAKVRHVRTAGPGGARVAACQVDGRRWATLEGLAEVRDDADAVARAVERYAARYRQPRPSGTRVALRITPVRMLCSAGLRS